MGKVCYIYSRNEKSGAARQLGRHLLIKRIRHQDSKFRGSPDKCVINWGASEIPYQASLCKVLNHPAKIAWVTNKLDFFKRCEGKKITPAFTVDILKAEKWIDRGYDVVCRTLLNASRGRGIVLAKTRERLTQAPLYTRYVPKKDEYRVHIFGGKIIDIQKKMMQSGFGDANFQIRNHDNGFIYGRNDIKVPKPVKRVALSAYNLFDLNFGAVDVIYTENRDQALALEINTAPGLEGQTVVLYADAFREYL